MAPSKEFQQQDVAASILVVEDDEDFRSLVVAALREPLRRLEQVATAAEAKAKLSRDRFDVVVVDLGLPDECGLAVMRWAQEHCPGACWIVLTARGTFDAAVEALQLGAFEFLSKPLRNVAVLRTSVRNAVERQQLLAERRRLHDELRVKNERLQENVEQLEQAFALLQQQGDRLHADIQRAGIIQRALLPQTAPRLEGWRVQALYRPSRNVGGDLYDVVVLDDRYLALVIADAAGHDLSAAMLAVVFKNRLSLADPIGGEPESPAAVLEQVNRALCHDCGGRGLFLTAAYCLVDTWHRTVTIASAGHPPLLVLRGGGALEQVFHTGPALGLYPDAVFAEQSVRLASRDRLFLHTDGLYQRLGGDRETCAARITSALRRGTTGGITRLQDLLGPAAGAAGDGAAVQEDDITLLLLDVAPGTSVLDNGTTDVPPAAPAPSEGGARLLAGSDRARTAVAVMGRASWLQSGVFHEECMAAIDTRRALMLDLTLCDGLDSTFLGTIHELCRAADDVDVELRLQGVMPPVEALFGELGMERVLEHVVSVRLPLPTTMRPLRPRKLATRERALRLLHAHEGLAALNARNRREFDPLLALVRRELRSEPPTNPQG